MRKDDWDAAQLEYRRLQDQQKVILYQPYFPKEKDPRKRPFVVVIQDEWIRNIGRRFSNGNSWAIDSIFCTNQYGLPLYAAVGPNQDGKRVPIFYVLCIRGVKQKQGQSHEGIPLELTLTAAFASIGDVRSSAILIDKHKTSLNAINEVVGKDIHCWRVENVEKFQVDENVLLCHFHIMKAWSRNLLTRVLATDKDNIWRALHFLMHCPQEQQFDKNLKRFNENFQYVPNMGNYIKKGWAGEDVPWRRLWPRFGRLFTYEDMDTTNHIERHWEWIKYTLLQGKVNRALRVLIVAIVGSVAEVELVDLLFLIIFKLCNL